MGSVAKGRSSPRSRWAWSLAVLVVLSGCSPGCSPGSRPGTPDDGKADDGDADSGECLPGVSRCEGRTRLECGADGTFAVAEECPDVCAPGLGCVVCAPGAGMCDADSAVVCRPDGSGYVDAPCDPLQGLACNPDSGLCEGACSAANLGKSYIGCEYYPTVTANAVDNHFSFAVAVSNASTSAADVHLEGGALAAPLTFVVAPGAVQVQKLPWVPPLKACNDDDDQSGCGAPIGSSALVAGGTYHLRSDRPVTVYQFNPLEYTFGDDCRAVRDPPYPGPLCSYSNDASLLLPVNAWTGRYFTASYPPRVDTTPPLPDFVTIAASRDDTEVTVTPRAAVDAGDGVGALPAGVPSTLALNAGDAVQLFSTTGDLTGSTIESSEPVQVIGGHYCTFVPLDTPYCDHVEESMFPLEALAAEYVVTAPAVPSLPDGRIRVVRIVATEPNTTLSYEPFQLGAAVLNSPGDHTDIVGTDADFRIIANHKVLVAQLMEGMDAGADTGDPAMTLAVPVAQYRTDYLFHAPQNYDSLYVNVIAPMTATVMLDGVALAGFTPIGGTGLGVLRHRLDKNGTGSYRIVGDEPFGIDVYGYGVATSFYYPGGLDLSEIVIQ